MLAHSCIYKKCQVNCSLFPNHAKASHLPSTHGRVTGCHEIAYPTGALHSFVEIYKFDLHFILIFVSIMFVYGIIAKELAVYFIQI
jgi:hypothetical protein